MARARMGLLAGALALAVGTPAAAQNIATAYVVLGAPPGALGVQPVARAVIEVGAGGVAPECPTIEVDDGNKQTKQTMSRRYEPDGNFPNLVCEFVFSAPATSAKIDGWLPPLPLPPSSNDKLKSIAVLGDTGCRLKADKDEALAARDPDEADEIEEGGKYQDCNNPVDWPFAYMSAKIAKAKPDLVVHVGDYYYREDPCPGTDPGCQGSPYGDNWNSWKADFFAPAAPLLQAAPWIVVRGNHEDCDRGWPGYARFLDPRPAKDMPAQCEKVINQYSVAVGGRTFIVLDSSDAKDECSSPKDCKSERYTDQFKAMGTPKPGTWLVTHKPIWGFTEKKKKLGRRNSALQYALADWQGVPPKNIDLVLSGHIHLWEALSFVHGSPPKDQRPPQLVLGNGSTELAKKITLPLNGETIGGRTVGKNNATDHRFGYTLFAPSKKGKHWNAALYDACGEPKLACDVETSKVTCRKPKG